MSLYAAKTKIGMRVLRVDESKIIEGTVRVIHFLLTHSHMPHAHRTSLRAHHSDTRSFALPNRSRMRRHMLSRDMQIVPGDVVVCTNDTVVLHMSPQAAAGLFVLVDGKVREQTAASAALIRLFCSTTQSLCCTASFKLE